MMRDPAARIVSAFFHDAAVRGNVHLGVKGDARHRLKSGTLTLEDYVRVPRAEMRRNHAVAMLSGASNTNGRCYEYSVYV